MKKEVSKNKTRKKQTPTQDQSQDLLLAKQLLPLYVTHLTTPLQTKLVETYLNHPECQKLYTHYQEIYDTLKQPIVRNSNTKQFSTWLEEAKHIIIWGISKSNKTRKLDKWQKRAATGIALGLIVFVAWMITDKTQEPTTPPQPETSENLSVDDTKILPNDQRETSLKTENQEADTLQVDSTPIQNDLLLRLKSYEWMMLNHFKKKWRRTYYTPVTYIVISPKNKKFKTSVMYQYLLSLTKQYKISRLTAPSKLHLNRLLPKTMMLIGHKRKLHILLAALQRQGNVTMTTQSTKWKRIPSYQQRVLVHFSDQ